MPSRWNELPESIRPLGELATNLWWSWDEGARRLLERALVGRADSATAHPFNPVAALLDAGAEGWASMAADAALVSDIATQHARLRSYIDAPDSWYARAGRPFDSSVIAYFSAEFGLVDSLPTYSGGLGILAGDHAKSASDLGLPFVGLSLLYRCGYVDQSIDASGWQQDSFSERDFDRLPLERVCGADGSPLAVDVPVIDRHIRCRVWRVVLGRTSIYLLDADDPANTAEDRATTRTLYDADMDVRMRQEILLGVGGVRLLRALDRPVACYHMNEGHAAFLGLERMRELMADGTVGFDEARRRVAAESVFTTHTPVEAGHDRFAIDQMQRYFGHLADELGLSLQQMLLLGLAPGAQPGTPFNMTYLAIRTSRAYNGVSKLHGEVSRHLFQPVWPQIPVHHIPVTSVTNGVHASSWISPEMASLFHEALGADWRDAVCDTSRWNQVLAISDEALWNARRPAKERLIAEVRRRELARRQREKMGAEAEAEVDELLSPDAFTIGFARRFAPYKRATLFLQDPDRIRALVGNTDRPVQLVFAGKSHPRNEFGKRIIQSLVRAAATAGLRGRVVLVENYDILLGHLLVQGVDLWLNNPRKPEEASGTSGMKAAMNGVLNCSILDGWWPEGYRQTNGWAIGAEGSFWSQEEADRADARTLYDVLEQDIVPTYYRRDASGRPARWIGMMRESIRTVAPVFNTHRMVQEYVTDLYRPLPNGD